MRELQESLTWRMEEEIAKVIKIVQAVKIFGGHSLK